MEHVHAEIIIKNMEKSLARSCSNPRVALQQGLGHSQLPHLCEKGIESSFTANALPTVMALGSKNLLSVRKNYKTFNKR